MTIDGHFDASVFEIGKAVSFVFEAEPNRQSRSAQLLATTAWIEVENFLPRGINFLPQQFRKELRQPRPTREDIVAGRNAFASFRENEIKLLRLVVRRTNQLLPVRNAALNCLAHYCLHCSIGDQRSAIRL